MAVSQSNASPLAPKTPLSPAGERAIAALVFALGVVLLWTSAPQNGEFWWSDSPRHALNGVFIQDLIAAFPWRDPAQFAAQYYVQYPALTILFYPPLFYVISAPFFALFGVSHATALSVVIVHYFALAFGLYLLARRWLTFPIAVAVGLSIMAIPGVALWGRQVMLEVPAMAFAIWAFVLLRRYAETAVPRLLYIGAFLLLCAIYTKFSAIFLAPVATLMLLMAMGKRIWPNRHIWTCAALFIVGFIPVAFLTLKFGQANLQSVTGVADSQVSRASLAGWVWYAAKLPELLAWPLLLAAVLGVAMTRLGRPSLDKVDNALLLGWFVVGYLFFSLIDLKEARHATLLLPPLMIFAGLAATKLLPQRLAAGLALALVVGTGIYTWRYHPVPTVAGYAEAASWIARHTPDNSVVMFSGNRDGSFIFNLRSHDDRRDLYVIRADKLMLDIAVRREIGVDQKSYSAEEIGAMLDRYGVHYVVAQSDFWTDLEIMGRLQEVLRSDHFEQVDSIPVRANLPVDDKELRIYRNTHPIPAGHSDLILNLPIIGRSVEGRVGGEP